MESIPFRAIALVDVKNIGGNEMSKKLKSNFFQGKWEEIKKNPKKRNVSKAAREQSLNSNSRHCTCGSGLPWVNCSFNTPYCG